MEPFPRSIINSSSVCQPPCPASSMEASFKLDEGYSEETKSQEDGDSSIGIEPETNRLLSISMSSLTGLPDFVLALSEADRSEYVYNVLRTLRTSSIAAIIERLRPRLHIDPVVVLPPELTSQIFSYLPPPILLEASKVSKAWRDRTLDSRLWRQKFLAEGWDLNTREVSRHEQSYYAQRGIQKTKSRKADHSAEQRKLKKRTRTSVASLLGTSSLRQGDPHSHVNQQGSAEADADTEGFQQDAFRDEVMQDAESHAIMTSTQEHANSFDFMDTQFTSSTPYISPIIEASMPSNMNGTTFYGPSGTNFTSKELSSPQAVLLDSPNLDFHYLYKQKRKLEENWSAGKYKSFQLPHKDFPFDAHTECVYTIQYSGKYLVSGSRDHTIRIWDLDTQRLIRKPLTGHIGSVLCLQFDDSEKEDIIISGSSDTDVILWQFSTGKMLKKISQAHRESVLNLKFDDRFLVTCSKDKMIKVWNRQELQPGDRDYPVKGIPGGGRFPAYIIDLTNYATPSDIEQHLSHKQKEPLARYTNIMTIDQHGAAVNAVHIYKDQLVSASGDRSVKVWDIHSGVCTAICMGHTKGIACVQYDGKRIVSGSSDDTIRIFDPVTRAEVACLKGHVKLVRTIQASFGDEPGSKQDLEQEAKAIDNAYFEARASGAVSSSERSERHRERNAGSKRPEDIMAYGAKLPPGGGGSRWGRIVSGSYDETVIVWKRAGDGRWIPGHKLNQADALRAAGGPLIAESERLHRARQAAGHQHHGPLVLPPPPQQPPIQNGQPAPHVMQQMTAHMTAQQVLQQAMHTGTAALQAGVQNVAAVQHPLGGTNVQNTSQPFPGFNAYVQQVQAQAQAQVQANTQHQQHLNAHLHAAVHQQQQQNAAHNHAPNQPVNLPAAVPSPQPNARVFKLQFDARRIICCSQDPKIVGWDFADGDEDIIECSKFFGPPT